MNKDLLISTQLPALNYKSFNLFQGICCAQIIFERVVFLIYGKAE